MRRLLLMGAAVSIVVAACGETQVDLPDPTSGAGPTSVTGPTGPTVVTGSTGSTGATAPVPCGGPGTLNVDAKANVFAAGIGELPHPAGGGGGVFPVCVLLPSGSTRLQVTGASGEVSFNPSGSPTSGPDGDTSGSYAGGLVGPGGAVSGISSSARVGFVAGVFLGDGPPAVPPNSRTFDDDYDFADLAPELGQLFYVGDGTASDGTVQTFVVPDGATRLYFGIADGFSFSGEPGYYDDNTGSFSLTVGLG